jgi:hypothetical protein
VLITLKDKEPTVPSFLELEESFGKPSFHKKPPLLFLLLLAFEDSSFMEISAISETSSFVSSGGVLTYRVIF